FRIVPAIIRELYNNAARRIAGLVILIDIPPALDIAALSALGLQVEDDRRHVALGHRAQQLVLGDIEGVLDRLPDGLLQSLMAPAVLARGGGGAGAISLGEDVRGGRDEAGRFDQRRLDIRDGKPWPVHWSLGAASAGWSSCRWAATSSKFRPSPSSTACWPVNSCQRFTATST